MATRPRTVRVDAQLAERLDDLARQRLIPDTFTAQVNAGLTLLVRHAEEAQTRQAARMMRATEDWALPVYRQLRGDGE